MKSNKTVKIIIFTALFLSAVILISVMTGAVKETTADTDSVKLPVIMYHSLLRMKNCKMTTPFHRLFLKMTLNI